MGRRSTRQEIRLSDKERERLNASSATRGASEACPAGPHPWNRLGLRAGADHAADRDVEADGLALVGFLAEGVDGLLPTPPALGEKPIPKDRVRAVIALASRRLRSMRHPGAGEEDGDGHDDRHGRVKNATSRASSDDTEDADPGAGADAEAAANGRGRTTRSGTARPACWPALDRHRSPGKKPHQVKTFKRTRSRSATWWACRPLGGARRPLPMKPVDTATGKVVDGGVPRLP